MKPQSDPEKADGFNIGEVFANIWEGRYLMLGSIVGFLMVGILYAYTATPIYQVEGLLQTEVQRSYGTQPSDFAKMEGPYSLPTAAPGEIEILKSNHLLAQVVEELHLDVSSAPILTPVIGKLLTMKRADRPKIDIESFGVPEHLRGTAFTLIALPAGALQWNAPDGAPLAKGRPGEPLRAVYQGSPLSLKVRALRGKPGQTFSLELQPILDAIKDLRQVLQIEERGRNAYVSSNMLGLTLQAPDPERGAAILNEILNRYIRQVADRKTSESSKTLDLLQAQRPVLQAQLAEAESSLNEYRRRNGAVDTVRQGELYMQQRSSLDAQISALRQKRQELLRTYMEQSDLVVTTDQQIAYLQDEARKIDGRVSTLPGTQQEVARLTRDVQVKSATYTSLLNIIQQLQNTLAGSVGNARVVDYAIPSRDPIAPRKTVLMILFLFMGSVTGMGLTAGRRLLRRGIEDQRIIESKLGLPVLVTIPHSPFQKGHDHALAESSHGLHLLVIRDPQDRAVESFRTLRTDLQLSLEKASNRIVMITGPTLGIGKSFVSSNLATVLAQGGARVLLVDADLRKGSLHRLFGISHRAGGLAELLAGKAELKSVIQETKIPGLSLVTTGALPTDPLVLLMSTRFSEFASQVSEAFDFVILDAPPILPVADALAMGSKVGTILMVAKYGAHPLDELRACQKRLLKLGDRLKGYLFNDVKLISVGGLYGYYKYDYDYRYDKKPSPEMAPETEPNGTKNPTEQEKILQMVASVLLDGDGLSGHPLATQTEGRGSSPGTPGPHPG